LDKKEHLKNYDLHKGLKSVVDKLLSKKKILNEYYALKEFKPL